jgi:hypothetical protein
VQTYSPPEMEGSGFFLHLLKLAHIYHNILTSYIRIVRKMSAR